MYKNYKYLEGLKIFQFLLQKKEKKKKVKEKKGSGGLVGSYEEFIDIKIEN